MTIIFLLMLFLATWFGINLKGTVTNNSGQLELGVIAAVIFPISIAIAVVAVAVVLAFSQRDWLIGWVERIIDGTLDILGIHGSRGVERMRYNRRKEKEGGRPDLM